MKINELEADANDPIDLDDTRYLHHDDEDWGVRATANWTHQENQGLTYLT